MAIVVSRSSGALATTSSFQALSSLAGATVSSSFNVPSGVSAVKQISVGSCADGAGEEFQGMVKISGSSLKDGEAVFAMAGQNTMGTSTGSNTAFTQYDTNLACEPGRDMEISIAVAGSTVTADYAVTLQFE